MTRSLKRSRGMLIGCLAVAVALMVGCMPAQQTPAAATRTKIVTGLFAFPSLSAPVIEIVKVKGLAEKNGLDLETKSYSDASAFYTDLLTGEVNVQVVGVPIIMKMRNDGVPVQLISTYARLDSLQVLTANPEIKDVRDLRGKTLAADMTSSEFQVLSIYARSKGINLQTDATVAQAALPLARTRLKTGESEAAMLWEPTTTQALKEDGKEYRSIFNAHQAWQELTGQEGYQLVYAVREEYAKANPEAVKRWITTLQEGIQFIKSNVDEADAIVAKEVKLPPGIFKDAVQAGRIVYTVEPLWDEKPRTSVQQMFKAVVDVGYLDRQPAGEIFYQP
jgi:NitT/TauT family transport system substrate-binding protein